ncbi:MAG: ABC transporter permease [Firmicutes bacterium]|nr:ABC transporter permease [Bacillota bacterium]
MNTTINKDSLLNFLKNQGALVGLILLTIGASIRYDYFFTSTNLLNLVLSNAMLGIVAIGMTFVILTRGIDLSVGSLLALAGIVAGYMSSHSLVLALVIPILITTSLGFVNGVLIAKNKLEPFIVTLAMMIGVRGFVYAYTEELSISISDTIAESFAFFGRGELLGLPVPIIIFIVLLFIAGFVLKYTTFGRHVLAVGGNQEAAKLMGLKVERIKIMVYALNGALAGLAGVILASRLGVGQPVAGLTWELDAIAAVVIGGTYLTGGRGTIFGTFVGVILLALIYNIINMEGTINSWWQPVIRGTFLILVVIIQAKVQRKQQKE